MLAALNTTGFKIKKSRIVLAALNTRIVLAAFNTGIVLAAFNTEIVFDDK